jgi:hypothetical protein
MKILTRDDTEHGVEYVTRSEAMDIIEDMEVRHAAVMLHTQGVVDEANAMRATLEAIEERYIDGSDTYEDWRAMGELARSFLSANA